MAPDVRHGPRGGKKANLSPLMEALTSAQEGEVVNACPFGCKDEDLDAKGQCQHLVGVTVPTDPTKYEELLAPDEFGNRRIDGGRIHRVRPGDKLLRITTSHRVYRDRPKDKE